MTSDGSAAALGPRVEDALASANVLFEGAAPDGFKMRGSLHKSALETYLCCLRAIKTELARFGESPESAQRLWHVVDSQPDSMDYMNELMADRAGHPFALRLEQCVWDVVRQGLPRAPQGAGGTDNSRLAHELTHSSRLFELGLAVLREYVTLLETMTMPGEDAALARVVPEALGDFSKDGGLRFDGGKITAELLDKVRDRIRSHDLFSTHRTYRAVENEIRPGPLASIRSLDDFYGYRQERTFFDDHFSKFREGEQVPPLLLSGVPGVGKTHLTIAYAMSLDGVTLITADQHQLEATLENLLSTLGRHRYRRFVLFFDDIVSSDIQWAFFRNLVDGFLPSVGNVALVLATNGEYPAPIRSRCSAFEVRPMNPEVCQEFVADYLEEHRWMSQPYPDLVSTVAADYATMYKRRIMSELTPRSLIRYFSMLEGDKKKIGKLIRESLDEIVRVPTEEPFVESNRAIIERLERERSIPTGHVPPAQGPGPAAEAGSWELHLSG